MFVKAIPVLSTTVMRAVIVSKFGGPEVLEVRRDIPIPKPEASEVLIKVAAIGINPVDTYIRAGNYGRLPELPYIPGNDVAGTIVQAGADVKNFKEGDRVATFMRVKSGAYAEYCVTHPDWLIQIPENCDFRKGAAVGVPYFTAYKALLLKAKAKPTDVVLVHGASGGVGLAACQLALSQGMTTLGTAGSEEGMEALRGLGVHHVFNHKEEGYTEKITKVTGGGPTIILEMLSNVNLNEDLKLLAPNGVVVVVGCRGTIDINPRLLMAKETQIQGVALGVSQPEEFALMNRAISAGLKQGWLDPVVGKEFSLNNAARAHEEIIHNTGAKGKMVLIV
ncbi:quinone oxidoreductase-like [Clavelina lepadiformis]